MRLRFIEAPERARGVTLSVYSVDQLHATVHWHLLRGRRGKAIWCWGPVGEFTEVRDVQGCLLTHLRQCGWHTIFMPAQFLSWIFGSWAFCMIVRVLLVTPMPVWPPQILSPVLGPLPALAALRATIHLAEGPAPFWEEFCLEQWVCTTHAK